MKNKKLIMLIALIGISSSIRSLDYEDIFSQVDSVVDILDEEDAVYNKRQKINDGPVQELLGEEFKEESEKLEFIYGSLPEDSNINNELLNENYEGGVDSEIFSKDKEEAKEVKNDSRDYVKSLVVKKKYPCTKDGCTKSYNSIPGLKYHIESVHERRRYACEEFDCGRLFVQKKDLQNHIESFHERKRYKCKEDGCKKSYKRKDFFKKHMVMVHGGMHACKEEGCGQEFTQKDNLKLHVKLVHKGQPCAYICKEFCCGKSFKKERYLKAHIKTVHQKKKNSQEDV